MKFDNTAKADNVKIIKVVPNAIPVLRLSKSGSSVPSLADPKEAELNAKAGYKSGKSLTNITKANQINGVINDLDQHKSEKNNSKETVPERTVSCQPCTSDKNRVVEEDEPKDPIATSTVNNVKVIDAVPKRSSILRLSKSTTSVPSLCDPKEAELNAKAGRRSRKSMTDMSHPCLLYTSPSPRDS